MLMPGIYDGNPLHQSVRGKSFDDSESFISTNKLTGRSRGLPENNLLKSFSIDKEKANSVAKIKVVVCLSIIPFECLSCALPICCVVGSCLVFIRQIALSMDELNLSIEDSNCISISLPLLYIHMITSSKYT